MWTTSILGVRNLQTLKENLDDTTVIFLCDLAENFAFVSQDKNQSYHWTQNQATVHPIVIYYIADMIMHKSFCCIYNGLHHDTAMFYYIQKMFLTYIKGIFHRLKNGILFRWMCSTE